MDAFQGLVSEREKKKRENCKDCENSSLSELEIFFPLNCFGRLRNSNGEVSATGYIPEHHKLVHLNDVPGARSIPQPLHRMLSQYFHESKKNPFQSFSNFHQLACMLSHVCTLLPIRQGTSWVTAGAAQPADQAIEFMQPTCLFIHLTGGKALLVLVRVLITWVL